MIEPPLPQREIDPALFQQQQTQPSATANGSPSTWTGARSGRTYPSIASLSTPDPAARFHGSASTSASRQKQPTNAAIQALLSKNAISVGDMKQPRELLAKLESFSDRWNEILYILRPLLYGEHHHPRHSVCKLSLISLLVNSRLRSSGAAAMGTPSSDTLCSLLRDRVSYGQDVEQQSSYVRLGSRRARQKTIGLAQISSARTRVGWFHKVRRSRLPGLNNYEYRC